MSKRVHFSIHTTVAALVLLCVTGPALALNDDFTAGDFENLQYVGNIEDPSEGHGPANYNVTVSAGAINNGPTTEMVTADSGAPSNPPNQDYPPPGFGYIVPATNPPVPGGSTQNYGNWNVVYHTGFGDWNNGFNSKGIFSNSTTTGVTKGTTAIALNPNLFGGTVQSGNYTQHLALSVTIIGRQPASNPQLTRDPTGAAQADADYTNIQSHKYFAVDVTFKSSDWTHGTFTNNGTAGTANAPGAANVIAYINAGTVGGIGVFGDRTGFQNLGQYVQNTANPAQGINRPADYDSRRALLGGTPGIYDPGNHTGTYTTTLYWDYSHWQAPPTTNPGDPPSGVFYDLRTFFNDTSKTSGTNGYCEFLLATGYDNGYTAGVYYFDNWRYANEILRLGDFNNDGHIDAQDIKACEAALTDTAGYEANPTGLSGLTLSAQDMRTIGDVNGDGKFNNADLQSFLDYLKAGKGSLSAVPEPASMVLLGLAVPGLAFAARRLRASKG